MGKTIVFQTDLVHLLQTQGQDAESNTKLSMKLWKMRLLLKNAKLSLKGDAKQSSDKNVHLIRTLNVPPNIVNNVEIGRKRNVPTLGETNVVNKPKKSAMKILDQSKYPMLKTNVSPRKKRDVRSIGKNEVQERRFG